MKKITVFCLMLVAALAFSCSESGSKKGLLALAGGGTGDTSQDIVNDQASTDEFQYQTVKNVSFDLTILDADGNPIDKVMILVNAGEDGEVGQSVTGTDGKAVFSSSIKTIVGTITLTFENNYYVTKVVEINDIQQLQSVIRTIYLEKKDPPPPSPKDSDGDGVPDDQDEFPNDPALIGTVKGEYTIAYEDLYPQKGDADFNDLVVKLTLKEYITPDNKVSKVDVTTKVLAAGAGYVNQFYIGIGSKDYKLIMKPKNYLNGGSNTEKGESFYDATPQTQTIVFKTPVPRADMPPMPYDPFIKANGVTTNQVHLPFVKAPRFTGNVLDSDKFPWAILVPANWAWPYESASIFTAYPKFKGWYESDGTTNKDWYLSPDSASVFPVGTAIGAYIMKVLPGTKSGILIGMIAGIAAMVVGINFWRKKKHDSRGA